MKKIFQTLILLSASVVYSQDCGAVFWQQTELSFFNYSSQTIEVTYYPVSSLYTNTGPSSGDQIYTLINRTIPNQTHNYTQFINGDPVITQLRADYLTSFRIDKYTYNGTEYILKKNGIFLFPQNPNNTHFWIGLNHDPGEAPYANDCKGSVGYGLYKFIFSWGAGENNDYCYFEADGVIDSRYSFPDLAFIIENGQNNQPEIYYKFINGIGCLNIPCQPISSVNKHIKAWQPYIPQVCTTRTDKNFGNFRYKSDNTYNKFPLDAREDCNISHPSIPTWATDQNITYADDNTFGKLLYNLTLEKNLSTPTTGNRNDLILVPELTNTQSPKGPFLKIASEKVLTLKKFDNQNLGTDLYVNPECMLWLEPTNNSSTHTIVSAESFCDIEVKTGGKLKLENYGEIWLKRTPNTSFQGGTMKLYPNSILEGGTAGMSEVLIWPGSALYDCGAIKSGLYCFYPIREGNEVGQLYVGGQYCNEPVTQTYTNGAVLKVGGGDVIVSAGSKIVFDGANTKMIVEPSSTIKLGQGASIEFKNGAYLDANGATFTSLNTGDVWNGIRLENAGSQTVIQNCTFNNAVTSVYAENTQCIIRNNNINVPLTGGVYGIHAYNQTNITIQNNTINAGANQYAIPVRFFNIDGEGDGLPGGVPSSYSLNIVGNNIYGGGHSMELTCVTSAQLPFYIYANQIYPNTAITSYGIFAYKISGEIKQNTFHNSSANKSLTLQFSNVSLYGNVLLAETRNLYLNSSSFVQMAPILNEVNDYVWIGGSNRLTSSLMYNIELYSGGNALIAPGGSNCFITNTNPSYHIFGEICLGAKPYQAANNYWSPSTPAFNLLCNGNNISVNYTPTLSTCPIIDPQNATYEIIDHGNGIYDTIMITPSESGDGGGRAGSLSGNFKSTSITSAAKLYGAITSRNHRAFHDAIIKCKDIIDNNDTSEYINSALTELYRNYLESDTTGNQIITTGLFNSLKTYIAGKMQQYYVNPQFTEKLYQYYLMCLVKCMDYQEAIAGYENIINNHPDEIVRLNASWDRSAVILLMGQGGGENQLKIAMQSRSNFKLRIKKLLDKNPAHKIAKNIFTEVKENLEAADIPEELKYTKEEKDKLDRRIEVFNPSSAEELKEKINSDIMIIAEIQKSKAERTIKTNTLKRFTLHQNYPNPFNPTTTIKYDIPKDGFISLKIYDVLGREVFSINEFKKAGSHETVFDGSGRASGVYFYSLESNGLKETKKMLMVK